MEPVLWWWYWHILIINFSYYKEGELFWLHNDRDRRAISVVACGDPITGVRVTGSEGRYKIAGRLPASRVCAEQCVNIAVRDRPVYQQCFDLKQRLRLWWEMCFKYLISKIFLKNCLMMNLSVNNWLKCFHFHVLDFMRTSKNCEVKKLKEKIYSILFCAISTF